ncbi:MAG: radical SAM protein [Planctomycetes bacterium]|nr:radical SAM protein [Planctomycetota bacterium]
MHWFDDDLGDTTPEAALEIHEEVAREILSENDSPDLAFRYSVNPYRGCTHGCAYCYARPTHSWLGYGAGTDFDTKIVVKTNAPELLDRALRSKRWKGDPLVFSGVTDCYQPIERRYRITRRCLEVCAAHRCPVSIITKSPLVLRDIDVLRTLPAVRVFMSIPFLDDGPGRALEPFVAAPTLRFRALRELAAAGIDTGISIAPLIPGLNEHELPGLIGAAASAGVQRASLTLLRLPREAREVFEERLRSACPGQDARVRRGIEEFRQGQKDGVRFGERMVGTGTRWDLVVQVFEKLCKRHDLHAVRIGDDFDPTEILPPARARGVQRQLFED